MFYAHFVLSKKGPLARIWLAAHWDKKLTRAHVFETNISSSVEAILEPQVKLALRTSGHLLLGVVRIYSRQAKYLLADCNEAFVKIKMAFRPGTEGQEDTHKDSHSLAAITLADNMQDFESTLAELTDMDPYSISVNQSRPEDITMREEFGEPNLGRPDDDFGDSTFEDGAEREYGVAHSVCEIMETDERHEAEMSLTNELVRSQPSQVYVDMPPSVSMASNGEFDDMMDVDYDSGEDLDRTMEEAVLFNDYTARNIVDSFTRIDSELGDTTVETCVGLSEEGMGGLGRISEEENKEGRNGVNRAPREEVEESEEGVVARKEDENKDKEEPVKIVVRRMPPLVLAPVTQAVRTEHQQLQQHRRIARRKRRLLIDEHKSIPSEVMKMQMQDTSEITARLDLAPPTRKLMQWKETGSVDSLFSSPGRAILSRVLQRLFYRNLRTVCVDNDSPDGLPKRQSLRANIEEEVVRVVDELCKLPEDKIEENIDGGMEGKEHEMYRIPEDILGAEEERHPEETAGPCSVYSGNYDCFSEGPGTPHIDEDLQHPQEHQDTALTPGEHSFNYSQPSIEEVRMSVTSLDNVHHHYSANDDFDTTFTDRSIVSGSIHPDDSERDHDKLQNTMLALDNELDLIDQLFPLEMTQEGLEKRSQIMLSVLQDAIKRDNIVDFHHLTVSNNKKQAASKFYTLLLLGKQKAIRLHQESPFSNIIISPYE